MNAPARRTGQSGSLLVSVLMAALVLGIGAAGLTQGLSGLTAWAVLLHQRHEALGIAATTLESGQHNGLSWVVAGRWGRYTVSTRQDAPAGASVAGETRQVWVSWVPWVSGTRRSQTVTLWTWWHSAPRAY